MSEQFDDVELVDVLAEIILAYRFTSFISLENDGQSVRFYAGDSSFAINLEDVRIPYRLGLLRLFVNKYTDLLIKEGPPSPQEIQSIIQRLNTTLSILETSDRVEIRRHVALTPFYVIDRLKFTSRRASKLFGVNLDIKSYEERLYREYLIPLFPYIAEDKIRFEGNKIRLHNEGLGALSYVTIRIVIGEQEFEFGEYTGLINPDDVKDLYAHELAAFSRFLSDQSPNINVKIIIAFQKFGRSFEYSLLSDSVGGWIDRLPSTVTDIMLAYEIPLDRLNPKDFERLCYWLVDEYRTDSGEKRFTNVLWLGESGVGEQGRDVVAVEASTVKSYVFQCKRVEKFGPSNLRDELIQFQNYVNESPEIKPDVYVLFTSGSVTPEMKKQGDLLAQQIGMTIDYWPKSRIDKLVRTYPLIQERFWKVIQSP